MSRNPLGWSYPAGAENDPNAPYNQIDPPEECPVCGEPNADEDGEPVYPDDPSFCSEKCLLKYCQDLEDEGI